MRAYPIECPAREGWGTLSVVVGARPRVIRFVTSQPVHLEVGSRAESSLCIAAQGVAALHFEVIWDGVYLWLQDPLRLGRTLVNGETLNDWTPVIDAAFILFGSVCCVARASGPLCWAGGPDFDALERAKLTRSGKIRKDDTLRMRIVKPDAEG